MKLPMKIDSCSETRCRILQAAAGAFAANGFRASTINSIAHSAGMSEVTVFRYFPKKHTLYWEAVEYKLQNSGLVDHVVEALQTASTPGQFMETLGTKIVEGLEHDPALGRLLYFTVLELESEKKLLFKVHLKPLMQVLVARIESWIGQGEIRPVNPESAAVAIIGIVLSHYSLHQLFEFKPQQPLSPQELASQYADICVAGLTPVVSTKN